MLVIHEFKPRQQLKDKGCPLVAPYLFLQVFRTRDLKKMSLSNFFVRQALFTSNHNYLLMLCIMLKLFLILFLHQTTTYLGNSIK